MIEKDTMTVHISLVASLLTQIRRWGVRIPVVRHGRDFDVLKRTLPVRKPSQNWPYWKNDPEHAYRLPEVGQDLREHAQRVILLSNKMPWRRSIY